MVAGFRSCGLALALVAVSVPARADFTDVATDAGIVTVQGTNGVAWADFNGDSRLDFIVNLEMGSQLFYAEDDLTFTDVTSTHAPGLPSTTYFRSLVATDLTHDGWPDLVRDTDASLEVFVNGGPTSDPPFRLGDDMGQPDFRVTDLDVTFAFNIEGVGLLDMDADGWLDLMVQNDTGVSVWINPADGSADFAVRDLSGSGLPIDGGIDGDYLTVADFNLDGRVDVAVRLDGFPDLYQRLADGTFQPVAPDFDALNDNKGGVVFCDFDADGDFDLFFTDSGGLGENRIWLQTGQNIFENSGLPDIMGVDADGVDCGDVDNDGDLDLFLSVDGPDQLWINRLQQTGTLLFVQEDMGLADDGDSEGAVFADYDRDGDLDLLVNEMLSNTRLYANDHDTDNYLVVRVLADVGSCPSGRVLRDDIGAVVSVESEAWANGVAQVSGGQGHGSQSPPLLHFGLPAGADVMHTVTVRFQHGDEGEAELHVVPADLGDYHLLTIVSSDPDGDGIPSSVEREDTASGQPGDDLDGDGLAAWTDPDSDGDGVSDAEEAGDSDPCTAPADSNGDGIPDYLDPFACGPNPCGLGVEGGGCARCAVGMTRANHQLPWPWLGLLALVALGRRLTASRRS